MTGNILRGVGRASSDAHPGGSLLRFLAGCAAMFLSIVLSPSSQAQSAAAPLVTGTWSLNVPSTGFDEKSAMSCRGTTTCTGQYTETVRPEGCSGYGIFSGNVTFTGLDTTKSGSVSGSATFTGPDFDAAPLCTYTNKPVVTRSHSYSGTWDQSTRTGTLVLVTGSPDFPTQQIAIKAETIAPAIATSGLFTAALDANGKVYAWGSDTDGQLGQGRQTFQASPVRVSGLPAVQHIAVFDQVLAVDTGGQVWAWGDFYCPHLGPRDNANLAKPGRLLGVTGMTRVAAGYCQSFALKADGTVWKLTAKGAVLLGFPANIVDISTNGSHLLALRGDGTVHAYGNNFYGQLGVGNTTTTSSVVQVPGLANVTAISAGYNSSMALLSTGEIRVWGQIAGASVTAPTAQAGLGGNAIAIAAYDYYFAAVRADATVWKWEGATILTGPTQISGFSGAARVALISTGSPAYFAIGSNGALSATGGNYYGQLGQGNTSFNNSPVAVPGFASGTSQVRTTGFNASSASVVALKSDGSVWFWGKNGSGQSGDGASLGSTVPLTVPIAATIRSITTGDKFAVALDATGRIWAWGQSVNNMIDTSLAWSQPSPKLVEGVSNVAAVSASGLSLVAYARTDGTAWQLGSGSNTQVAGLANIVGVAASVYNRFFLRSDGVLFGIGSNPYGELGNGTTVASFTTPVQVTGITGSVRKVVAAGLRVCAMTTDGRVYMWGADGNGASLTGGTHVPVLVAGISDAADIEASRNGVLVRRADGSLLALGTNSLADADGRNTSVPYPVAFHETVQAMALGEISSQGQATGYLVGKTGLLWGWGYNKLGWNQTAVGDGTYITRRRPVVVLAAGGSGSIDANNWYLDLQPATAETVPATAIPGANTTAQVSGGTSSLSLSATVMYRAADLGKPVNNFVFGLVPTQFLSFVKSAPDASAMAKLDAKAKANGGLVFVQLTPAGWTDVKGQLIAYSQGVANAAGGASNILSGIDTAVIPGARFCVGYGESADSMLSAQALREVLTIEGTATTVANLPCVISGIYLGGPPSSVQASPVTFAASIVGLSPTGSVQFKDGTAALGAPIAMAVPNPAVGVASLTTSTLAVGTHSIGAEYAGDAQNPAAAAEAPKLHVVRAQARVDLVGPASSALLSEVAFVATVAGNNATGTVQFKDGAANLGTAVPVVAGEASLRTRELTLGSHQITASYSGDAQNAAGASAALTHTVVNLLSARVEFVSSANPVSLGAAVTLTATVTGTSPTGTVTVREGTELLASKALSGGTASFALSSLAAGVHVLTAEYSGDASNSPASSAALFQEVTPPSSLMALTVTKSGQGSGTVSSSPAGIECGTTCVASYSLGSTVTLTATATTGSTFSAWGGACTGSGVCTVTMDAAKSVTASFSQGAGAGISASPASLAFGGQSMRTTAPSQAVTITNGGASSATVTSVATTTHFGVAHNCATLAAGASCTATVTFTPTAEGSLTGTLAVSTSGGNASVNLTGTGEKSLVTHYYRSILRRASDEAGKAYWNSEAARVAALGANVNETWFALAMSFYFSSEYTALNRNPTEYVRDLYSTFFNRTADNDGLNYWTGQMASGLPREVVLVAFMFSTEFANFASAIFGNTAARAEVDTVVDFYRGLLSRLPDSAGFNYWVGQFRTAQCAGASSVYTQVEAISVAYAESAEYGARNRSSTQFMADLYNAFLRRGGDLAGVQFWISQLDTGARTRSKVRQDFIASPEFNQRVANIISQGCMR